MSNLVFLLGVIILARDIWSDQHPALLYLGMLFGGLSAAIDIIRGWFWFRNTFPPNVQTVNKRSALIYDSDTNLYFLPIEYKDVMRLRSQDSAEGKIGTVLRILSKCVVDPLTHKPLRTERQWAEEDIMFINKVVSGFLGLDAADTTQQS